MTAQEPGATPRSDGAGAGRARGRRCSTAARARFASDGFAATTIRRVAADAGVDPSQVMQFFRLEGRAVRGGDGCARVRARTGSTPRSRGRRAPRRTRGPRLPRRVGGRRRRVGAADGDAPRRDRRTSRRAPSCATSSSPGSMHGTRSAPTATTRGSAPASPRRCWSASSSAAGSSACRSWSPPTTRPSPSPWDPRSRPF